MIFLQICLLVFIFLYVVYKLGYESGRQDEYERKIIEEEQWRK